MQFLNSAYQIMWDARFQYGRNRAIAVMLIVIFKVEDKRDVVLFWNIQELFEGRHSLFTSKSLVFLRKERHWPKRVCLQEQTEPKKQITNSHSTV